MKAFLIYPDDWLGSTHIALMDAIEERGYLRLLLHASGQPDCGLPNDPVALATLSMIGLKRWNAGSGAKILKCFFEKEGRVFNQRLLTEWQHQQDYHAERSRSGKKGAERRWQSNPVASGSGIAEPSVCQWQNDANPNLNLNANLKLSESENYNPKNIYASASDARVGDAPVGNRLKKARPTGNNLMPHQEEWFDQWWAEYPLHKAKRDAIRAFGQIVTGQPLFERVMIATRTQREEMLAREPQHRPYPAGWLRGHRWEDESLQAAPAAAPERDARTGAMERAVANLFAEKEDSDVAIES